MDVHWHRRKRYRKKKYDHYSLGGVGTRTSGWYNQVESETVPQPTQDSVIPWKIRLGAVSQVHREEVKRGFVMKIDLRRSPWCRSVLILFENHKAMEEMFKEHGFKNTTRFSALKIPPHMEADPTINTIADVQNHTFTVCGTEQEGRVSSS